MIKLDSTRIRCETPERFVVDGLPTEVAQPRICPHCEDKLRDGAQIQDARLARSEDGSQHPERRETISPADARSKASRTSCWVSIVSQTAVPCSVSRRCGLSVVLCDEQFGMPVLAQVAQCL